MVGSAHERPALRRGGCSGDPTGSQCNGMSLLIDTAAVAARDRVEFWANSSYEVYHPLTIRTDAAERFQARMWGEWLASVGPA